MNAVAWAVYLGANTVGRLADEWLIPDDQALERLLEAERGGSIRSGDLGTFVVNPFPGYVPAIIMAPTQAETASKRLRQRHPLCKMIPS